MKWSIPPSAQPVTSERMDFRWYSFLDEHRFAAHVPLGGIIPWAKSFTNNEALPVGWLECDGSVIDDPQSPFDGETLPDLNGDTAVLRGASTSGGTGEIGSGTGVNTYNVVHIMRIR